MIKYFFISFKRWQARWLKPYLMRAAGFLSLWLGHSGCAEDSHAPSQLLLRVKVENCNFYSNLVTGDRYVSPFVYPSLLVFLSHPLHGVLDLANEEVYLKWTLRLLCLQVGHHYIREYLTEMLHLSLLNFFICLLVQYQQLALQATYLEEGFNGNKERFLDPFFTPFNFLLTFVKPVSVRHIENLFSSAPTWFDYPYCTHSVAIL